MKRLWFLGFLALMIAGSGFSPAMANSAVVFQYNRFVLDQDNGEDIRADQLDSHVAELSNGKYRVLPLSQILESFRQGQALPDRAVALTIDDATVSAHRVAWPKLRQAGLAFTLFVSTESVGREKDGYLTWEQLRELSRAGVEFGSMGHSRLHMAEVSQDAIRRDIETANNLFQKELGFVPKVFAFPYGEASYAAQQLIASLGYPFAFGQHSGVASDKSDPMMLPRFTQVQAVADRNKFSVRANALPLPVFDITPLDNVSILNPPPIGFTIDTALYRPDRIKCFDPKQTQAEAIWITESRAEIRFPKAYAPGRMRVNCTALAHDGRWRWWGRIFYIPKNARAPITPPTPTE